MSVKRLGVVGNGVSPNLSQDEINFNKKRRKILRLYIGFQENGI
jgi:hypothetical protein